MRKFWLGMFVAFGVAFTVAHAQAPAGSTGQCKDGTYTKAASKRGACSGHGGVQTWMASAAPAVAPSAPAPAAPAVAPAAPASRASTPRPATPDAMANKAVPAAAPAAAQGGGPGMVWVNLPTKIYHCPGTRFYGTTKSGKYMTEAEAQAMGARGDHNKTCAK